VADGSGHPGAGGLDPDVTDLEGLPHEFRWSLWVLKQAERFGRLPSEIEEADQSLMGHLEREQIVREALKRYS